jgi:hypothetical protein
MTDPGMGMIFLSGGQLYRHPRVQVAGPSRGLIAGWPNELVGLDTNT